MVVVPPAPAVHGVFEVPWERLAGRVLEQRRPSFLDCYEQEVRRVEARAVDGLYRIQKPPSMEGRVVVMLPVETDGIVRRPWLDEDTLQNPDVGACLLVRARETGFPPPPGGEPVELAMPLTFRLMGANEKRTSP